MKWKISRRTTRLIYTQCLSESSIAFKSSIISHWTVMKYEIKCSEIKCTFAECDRSENGMNADGRKLIRLGLIDTCHLELTFTL